MLNKGEYKSIELQKKGECLWKKIKNGGENAN